MDPNILTSALPKIGDFLLGATIHHVGYLLRLSSNTERLKGYHENLRKRLNDMDKDVKAAKRNGKMIKENVETWRNDVRKEVEATQQLVDKIDEYKKHPRGLRPHLARRYRLSRQAEEKRKKLKKLYRSPFGEISYRPSLPGINQTFASNDVVPFETTKSTISQITEAVKDDDINIVGIYGIGGVGKTTMAQEAAKELEKWSVFEDIAFADVSKAPNFEKIQHQIAGWLGLKLDGKTEMDGARLLLSRIKGEDSSVEGGDSRIEDEDSIIEGKKILIVLDDVWEKLDLTKIGIPSDLHRRRCKILLTTRRKKVCQDMGCDRQIALDGLKEDESLALFKRKAGLGDELPSSNDSAEETEGESFNSLAKKIVRECKGLPSAIATLGNALNGKGIDEWEEMLEKLKHSRFVSVDNTNREIYHDIKSSYDYFKDEDTKLCFLLCSLFPEDYEIPLEELVKYGKGLDLFKGADTIERARKQLNGMINNLKDSCLLLDGRNAELVKMHDMVRDTAVWIASTEKKFFSKAGLGLKEWPEEFPDDCVGISLIANELEVLPPSLAYPKLEILLLDCRLGDGVKVSDQFFGEKRELKVVSLRFGDMSLKSLHLSTNLRSLCLHGCKLKDVSFIGKLSRLEILSFRDSHIVELAEELGQLSKLRLLDLRVIYTLKRIPAKMIQSLSKLQELYIGNSFIDWDVDGKDAEARNASLCELNSLSHLTALSLLVLVECIPENFTFPKLERYKITVDSSTLFHVRPSSSLYDIEKDSLKDLQITGIRSTSMIAFKEILNTVQILSIKDSKLRNIWSGCTQQLTLSNLTDVRVSGCDRLPCLFTVSLARSLKHLEKLSVDNCSLMLHIVAEDEQLGDGSEIELPKLRELNIDRRLRGLENFMRFCPENYYSKWPSLQKLVVRFQRSSSLNIFEAAGKNSKYLKVDNLARLRHGLKDLKVLEMNDCKAKAVFQLDGFDGGEGEHVLSFPSLEVLRIEDFKLECIWKGKDTAYFSSLKNLSTLTLRFGLELRHIFSTTVARHLLQLKYLEIQNCLDLEQIIVPDDKEDQTSSKDYLLSTKCFQNLLKISAKKCDKLKSLFHVNIARNLEHLKDLIILDSENLEQIIVGDDEEKECKEIKLPGVERLELEDLPSLVHLCPVGCHLIFPSLTHFRVKNCPKIATRFSVDQDGRVHAKAKSEAPQIGDEQAPTMDINCFSTNQIKECLPPFKKE